MNVSDGKAPKTFAKFQDLKYNDAEKWEYLKGYKRYKVRVPEAKESDYTFYQKVKQTGVIGSVRVPPQPIDARTLSFRDDHAARHGCTLNDAIKYVSDAKCSIRRKRWDGYSVNYYSFDGAAYVDPEANKIKTAFPASRFDEMTKKVVEVFK